MIIVSIDDNSYNSNIQLSQTIKILDFQPINLITSLYKVISKSLIKPRKSP